MEQRRKAAGELHLELTDMRRNPYLADYEKGRRETGPVRPAPRTKRAVAEKARPVSWGASGASQARYAEQREHRERERRGTRTVSDERRRSQRDRARLQKVRAQRRGVALGCLLGAAVLLFLLLRIVGGAGAVKTAGSFSESVRGFLESFGEERIQGIRASVFYQHPEWTEDFLTVNEYSRPGEPLPRVSNIFVHYTANPQTSAAQNRSYFENLKDNHERSASAHFIIGYEGEILQCIPLNEIAYAVQTRNYDSISIECCYLAEDGSFTQETYDSLIRLLKWLTEAYHLKPEDILRHYDCGGKKCPLYYTEHPDAWEQLIQDVSEL